MRTIDQILKEAGYTKKQLLEGRKAGRTNGMGSKGGIQWTKQAKKIPLFDEKHEQKLLDDWDLVSDVHDEKFNEGGGICDFIKCNYDLALRMIMLLHWSTVTGRISIFSLVFFGTNTFGIRTFHWTCIWRKKNSKK